MSRVDLPENVAVLPNQTYTFRFDVRAPATPGNYTFGWQMVKEYEQRFGQQVRDTVTVRAGDGMLDNVADLLFRDDDNSLWSRSSRIQRCPVRTQADHG